MTGQDKILITGATGTVGRQVAAQLLDQGSDVRGLVRKPDSAALPDGITLVAGDLSDPDSLHAALDAVDSVFLVWPFTSRQAATEIAPAVVDMIARRANRIVYLSAEGAARNPDRFWAILERLVAGSGVNWTALRPTGFAKNTVMWAEQIRTTAVVRWPYGAAARSLIDERDIAAVAVRALTSEGHAAATYTLSGPATLTQSEQVAAIGDAIGRRLRWQEITPQEARPGLVQAFGDEKFADGALQTWAGFADQPEIVTSTVQDITGAPARPFRQWAADHADQFR